MDITERKDYAHNETVPPEFNGDEPMALFKTWFAEAKATGMTDPNAFTLATVGDDGVPSARIVLLKAFDGGGFIFYTNLDSRKSGELIAQPVAAMCFFWPNLERQVRVVGRVERVPDDVADAYFAGRPRGSQLGAWASHQSAVLPDRATLETQTAAVAVRFADGSVPRPPFWGGFRIVPHEVEFWAGRPSRLHDRLRFTPAADGWHRYWLSP